jgi:Peptidase_C39 like family
LRTVARPWCVFALLALTGCAATGPQLAEFAPASARERIELEDTPFFPQSDYQCGPAALATALAASGVETTADDLVAAVYLPGRHGSLQTELIAATRARGRLPYVLPADVESMFAEVAGGRPVVVLQKLGAGPWPGWHYAVLIGYDVPGNRVVLRSGTERRLEMSAEKFLWSWDRGDRWALLPLKPTEMPAKPDYERYLEGAAGLEAIGRAADAEAAYRSAAAQWPDRALPHLGLGNLAYARNDYAGAAREYRAAIERDTQDPVPRNNLAETLRVAGCPSRARPVLDEARRLAGDGAHAATITATAAALAQDTARDRPECMAW